MSANHNQCEVFSQYAKIAEKIQHVLPEARVEHIGASSVEQCSNKGGLDIYVGMDEIDTGIEELKKLNFYELEESFNDDEKRVLMASKIDKKESDVYVYLITTGSDHQNDYLSFKQALENDPELIAQYNELKSSCEGLNESIYAQKKALFIAATLNSVPRN